MSGRSEHLIERAAAKLRGGVPVRLPDGTEQPAGPSRPALPDWQTLPAPEGPPRGGLPPTVRQSATPALAEHDDLPDTVVGPIPSPGAPLTRPIVLPSRPPLTIPPGPSQARAPAPGLGGQDARPNGAAPSDGLASPPTPGTVPQAPRPLPGLAPGLPLATAPRNTEAVRPSPAAGPSSTLSLQPPPIVQLDALERAGMVVARTTRTRISEEYRIAIGRILRVLHESSDTQGTSNLLMVTSARPGEGKSFTALNLAGSIAQNGTDAVLLVDVDPKVKPLSDQLGLGDVQGFLDLVSDPSLRPEDLLRVTAIPNLAVMPIGTRLGGAAQTVNGTASMRPIIPTIARLARRFPKHLIMLDAPPCLSTSDPHTLAPHVGQVVVVVEAERTQRSEVEAAVDLVRVCPSITLLLNKVRMTTSHTFGAYDYFGSYT